MEIIITAAKLLIGLFRVLAIVPMLLIRIIIAVLGWTAQLYTEIIGVVCGFLLWITDFLTDFIDG